MSKILLVNPPLNIHDPDRGVELTFPLGLGYLAAVLTKAGYHDIEILDTVVEGKGHHQIYRDTKFYSFGLSAERIRERIREIQPDIVGITCSFTKRFGNVMDVARIVKEIDSRIIVVIGGAHPSAMPQEAISNKEVDYVIIGEGEDSFIELIENIYKGRSSLKNIDGLAYKEKGFVYVNPKTRYIENLDSIPFPLRGIFPMDEYIKAKRNSIITSRGCPFHCSFCSIHSVWGGKWRGRSPQNVVNEIKSLVKTYGVDFISFDDDNLTFDRKRALGIFEGIIDSELKIYWNTPNGISIANLDRQLLAVMKDSGCYALNLAIESGDPVILNRVMRKTTTLDMARNVVKWCKELGILTLGYFVIGMPDETKESMQRSLDFAKELMLDVINVFIATPYPGSQLYRECVEKGYLTSADLVNYTAFDAVIETPYLRAEEVQEFLFYFIDEYNHFHDAHSDIPSAAYKEMIRRPTKEALALLEKQVHPNQGISV